MPRAGWKSQYPEAHRRRQRPAPRERTAGAGASWNSCPPAGPATERWGTGDLWYLRHLKPGGSRGTQDRRAPQRDPMWPPQTLRPGPSWTSAAAACRLFRSLTRPACQPPVAGFKGQGHPGIKEAGRAPKPKRFSTCPALDFSPWVVNEPGQGSPFMPTYRGPGLSLPTPTPIPNTWPLADSPIQSNFILLCLWLLCCFVNKRFHL